MKFGDLVAGAGAILLLIAMFFPWYKVSVSAAGFSQSESGHAWEALGGIDLLLLLCIIVVLAMVVIRAVGANVQLPVPASTIILGAGALAVLLILFRIIVLPGDVADAKDQLDALPGNADGDAGRSWGIFFAFLVSLAMPAGGFLSAQERGDAIPGVGGAGFGAPGGGGGGPLGGGAPAAAPGAGAPAATPAAQPAAAQPAAGDQPAAGGNPKADWYPDPQGQARLRYWDGTQWTDQTAD